MELGKVYTDCLTIRERRRTLDKRKVDELAKSMAVIGLQQPISVWSPNETLAVLVTGHHRFAAAVKLGWDEIDCIFVNMDEADRRLWEISENLHRTELTELERSEHINEWRRLTAEKVFQVETPSGGKQPAEIGVRKTASELGVSAAQVSRAKAIADIAPDAKEAVRAAGLDNNQSALLEVASAPLAQQVTKAEEVRQRREAGPIVNRISVPRDPLKAAEALCGVFSLDELGMLIAALLKARQGKEA